MAIVGRAKGSRNRGYFFRKGRGWCASVGNRAILLRCENGDPIRSEHARIADVKAAYNRFQKQQQEAAAKALAEDRERARIEEIRKSLTVAETARHYLDYCRANNSESTYTIRASALFDFCTGFPASLRDKKERPAKKRIHAGFGHLLVTELIPLHVDQWMAKHPRWNGCRRSKIKSLLRAFNYCVGAGLLDKNPIKGYKPGKDNARRVYITPEQEEAIYRVARADLALAVRVCIRTGARPICEFGSVTAAHVHEHDKGMEWQFSEEESKNGSQRIIRITDPEIIKIVRRQQREFSEGPLFRDFRGQPWTNDNLSAAFGNLKKRLEREGTPLDKGACMYATRHTYAKRVLQGFWSGKPTNIETLCALMGNSRQICWEYYAQWCDTYTDPLWASA